MEYFLKDKENEKKIYTTKISKRRCGMAVNETPIHKR
jgi:hypothetical protein